LTPDGHPTSSPGLTYTARLDHGGGTAGITCDESGLTEIHDERNPTVLTLTDNAASEIRNLIALPEIPDDGGVRIASNPDGALTLGLAGAPAAGDAVVEDHGARVFLEPQAGHLLDDKRLDASVDPDGNVQFTLADRG
jgi:Fe-S cluster assembly iron-binding protein IscA